jgi:hypothetical protein
VTERKLIVVCQCPPIPLRSFDWCAYRDGDEENPNRYGWGETKEKAIAELEALEEADQ